MSKHRTPSAPLEIRLLIWALFVFVVLALVRYAL